MTNPRSASRATNETGPPAQLYDLAPNGDTVWHDLIPQDQWLLYRSAIEAARGSGLRFMLGGGFGLAAYVGRWRNTKDIDLYIMPSDRDAMVQALAKVGFLDYYDQRPYDRGWIYRSTRSGVIVDIIWSMANRRGEVNDTWFQDAHPLTVRDESFDILPAEELLWCKLYVMQRDHCDWSDVINLLHAVGPRLDWPRLLERIDNDRPLLASLLTLFSWVSPNRALDLPAGLFKELNLTLPEPASTEEEQHRQRLLDSRAWFAAHQPREKPLEI